MGCLKWILTSLVGLMFWGAPALAPAATAWTQATSFFRAPDSVFPSGQVGRSVLEKSLLRQEQELFFQIRWNGLESRLPIEDGVIDLFCLRQAQLKENTSLLEQPRGDGKTTASLVTADVVDILEQKRNWMKVRGPKGEGWLPWNRLQARNDDLGIYRPIIDTFLRASPSHQGKVLTTISREGRLQALAYEASGWIKVTAGSQTGWVDLEHLAGRADFAAWAWEKGKGWFLSSHREGSFLRGRDHRKVALSQIMGFAPVESRLIVSRSSDPLKLPLRARAEIRNINITLWGISSLSDHGEVWWKKDLYLLTSLEPAGEVLTTEELLKRPIFSYALEEKKQIRGLASSQGIWRTEDGRHWKKLAAFGDQDLPVAIHPKGPWLVGTYRSSDQGVSFENSIRWDDFAKSVELKLLKPAKRLSLKKLDILPSSEIQILVDTGSGTLSFRSKLDGSRWY